MESQNSSVEPSSIPAPKGEHTGLNPKGVVAFAAALAVPGAGHLLNGRWRRGLIVAVILIGIFVLGLLLHGRLDTLDLANRLSIVFVFANAGSGIMYVACLLGHVGIDVQAQNPTFEYGTALLRLAGLLNYLVALDAYDVAVGRKP
ncbi:MAG TPA: hypothetical protein PLF26_19840 [Blastocatellia bacterium]|nr:hypothetical protein [Blastocatellia bacterium]